MAGQSADPLAAAEQRAAATVRQMRPDEKTILTHSVMPIDVHKTGAKFPEDAIFGAGYTPSISRLGVPALKETDASLGVAYLEGGRKDWATALPSAIAQAATWNPALVMRGGAMIGGEARAKGFNVLLAGGVNLVRDPRGGRTFEYFSEDPLLSGVLAGAAITGVQSNHIISTIKHLALNGQETGRKFVDMRISDAAARESDLLAFQIGIEQGHPGAVMCAYNRVNGHYACDSDYLLNRVLKHDWSYKGFVMSDWGAVHGVGAALNGLDRQSGEQLDPDVYFDSRLAAKAAADPAYAARLDDMNKRVLTAIYANGLDKFPASPGGAIDFAGNAELSAEVARQGIVLLKNDGRILPLAATAKSIAVIGGYADGGVLSGAGSSQVQGKDGPAVVRPKNGSGSQFISEQYHRSSPLAAIKARAGNATVTFRDGRYIADAVQRARQAEVAIVFATQWMAEGIDVPDLSLPYGQDELIAAVAAANPRTIVVLETGSAVKMPWLDKVAGVVEAWYPGARGGEAIAAVLFGEANPSGRLPITFPASEAQLPRPHLDGSDWVESAGLGEAKVPERQLSADYDIEGSDVGYRWFSRTGARPLFPFGYGLSYTSFEARNLKISGFNASVTIRNTGARAGDEVAQLYLLDRAGAHKRRLVGFSRISLEPGVEKRISIRIDPRLLADWNGSGWQMPAGAYEFAIGKDAETMVTRASIRLPARTWSGPAQ
ncbi:beta-glucosidase [Novosphingobium colocasiae]|nr:glycoside hydrolase family 3 C-terminal domain-containing protein [Novosphingobium colocasiae]